MFYQKIIRPFLFFLPAEVSHNFTLCLLKFYGLFVKPKAVVFNPIELMGIQFPNRVGLAAGLDKNAVAMNGLAAMGFGFIEVGTVTPKAQAGNPKPRLFRLPLYHALINRFGFNGVGVDQFVKNIKSSHYQGILGVNIGKNAITPNDKAVDDYLYCLEKVYLYASYVTINISSPNTKNIRELQHGDELNTLLSRLKQRQKALHQKTDRYVPLVIKISPDLSSEQVMSIADIILANNMDAVMATNTSSLRSGVENSPYAAQEGGLSGQPIRELSLRVVSVLAQALQKKIPIIGLGGIASVADMQAMLDAGADLVQVYTGFIYQGPKLIYKLIRACKIKK